MDQAMGKIIPTFMQSCKELIAVPSISSFEPRFDQSNRPVVDLLAGWLENLGFSIELLPVSGQPEKLNLLACLGRGPGGLVLSGHTDTVPFDESAWDQDPFRLTERDGRLYGLGTADMKSFFAIVLETLAGLDLARLNAPLYVLATCDEESSMSGARTLLDSGRQLGQYALIGEPTGLKPVHMHKGIVMEKIKLIGQAGHASDPALGNSALEGMYEVIRDLLALRTSLQQNNRNAAFKVDVPTLNFGSIHGGDNPNRICGDCELSIDIRLLPGMEPDDIRASMKRTVMQAIDGTGLIVEFDAIVPGIPPMQTDLGSKIIKSAEQFAGHPSGTVAFGTEGPYFNAMGMDTVVLGAGDIDQAHQANEYLAMDRIKPMQDILAGMVNTFCCMN